MDKTSIAIIFGGFSSEYAISLQSASAIIKNFDTDKYEMICIGITKLGEWFVYEGDYEHIQQDTWHNDSTHLIPISIAQNRNIHGYYEYRDEHVRTKRIDFAFPILHGRNGEDGTVQGLFELAGIPIIGCDMLSSALCMNKYLAHQIVGLENIATPKSIVVESSINIKKSVQDHHLSFPLFVKPLRAGSSFGITKIYEETQLCDAVQLAFEHDKLVIIEESIDGFEVGCAIIGIDQCIVGRVDEIELEDGFFDYEKKYTLKKAKIHMPARIDEEMERKIQEVGCRIYRLLGCSGFARVDMFLTPSQEIVFNEVNTIPGFTTHSRFPNMMKGIDISFKQLLNLLIEMYVG